MESKFLSWSDFLYIGFALAVMMSIRDDSREEFLLLVMVGVFFVCTGIKANVKLLKEFILKYPIYAIMTGVWTIYFGIFSTALPKSDKYAISIFGIVFAGFCLAKIDEEKRNHAFAKLWMLMLVLVSISVVNFVVNPPENGRMQLFFINPNIEGYAIIIFLTVSLLFIPNRLLRIISGLLSFVAVLCTSSKACSLLYVCIIAGYFISNYKVREKDKNQNRKRIVVIAVLAMLLICAATIVLFKSGSGIIQRLGNRHLEAITDILNFIRGNNQPVDYSTSTNQRLFDYIMALEFFSKGDFTEIMLGRGLMHQFLDVMYPTFIRVFSITTGGLAGPSENTLLSLMYDSGAIAFAMYGGVFISVIICFVKAKDAFAKKISVLLVCLMLLGLTVDMEYLIGIMFVEWYLIGAFLGTISIEEKETILIPSVIGAACIIPIMFALPEILSWLRTIANGNSVISDKWYGIIWPVILVVMIIAILIVIYCFSRSVSAILFHKRLIKKQIIFATIGVIVFVVGVFLYTGLIEKIRSGINERIEAERSLITDIQGCSDGELYVDTFPEAYDREFGRISNSIFRLRELVAYDNVTIVADRSTDSHLFENKGFLYTVISDWDAVYTNDDAVIKYLEDRGNRLTSFCTDNIEVSLQNGSATVNMYDGTYTATYELGIDTITDKEDYEVGILKVENESTGKTIIEEHLNRSQFDDDGKLIYDSKFIIYNNGIYKIKFNIESADSHRLECKSLSYTKTPEYDVRIKINDIGKPSHQEYLDYDGNPYMMPGGYFGVDNEFDAAGNAIKTTYLGADGQPAVTEYGYAILYRDFNDKAQAIRITYHDINDNKTMVLGGKASEEYEYDWRGYITEIRYYGLEDEPILYFGQYFCIKKEINELGQETHHEYYGIDGNPILVQGEYSSADYIYNEAGILSKVVLYDLDGKVVR